MTEFSSRPDTRETPSQIGRDVKLLAKFDPSNFKRPPKDIWVALGRIAEAVAEWLGCRDPLTCMFIRVLLLGAKVFDSKQRGYGPFNISKFNDHGVLVRLNDKIERLVSLYNRGLDPGQESRDDTFGDAGNYGFIGLMCRWGLWPELLVRAPDPIPDPEHRAAMFRPGTNIHAELKAKEITEEHVEDALLMPAKPPIQREDP